MNFLYQQINNPEMMELLKKEDMMILCNNEKEYLIHKVILLKSFFVKSMLTSGLKKEIKIKLDISNENLNNLHKYFYFNKIELNMNNILELLFCSEYLLLEDLQKEISEYLNNLKLDLLSFEKYVELLKNYYVILKDDTKEKITEFINENYFNYCLSDIIKNEDIVLEYLLKCNINDFLKISNNLLSLQHLNNNKIKKFLKNKILKDKTWKYLSKNEFWMNYVPLLKLLNINLNKLKDFNKNMFFINRFDGKIKNIDDEFKLLKLSKLNVGDYLDVLDHKNKWYLCKILEKFGNNIKVRYRGWCERFNECLNIEYDIDRLDLKYNKSKNYQDLGVNTFMEYKVDNKWLLFKVVINDENYIGLKEYKKNAIIKLKHNNLDLAEHQLHIKKIIIYYGMNEIIDVNWDDIPYDTYLEEQ